MSDAAASAALFVWRSVSRLRAVVQASVLLFAAFGLASCHGGLSPQQAQTHSLSLKGNVYGGQQPIGASLVQLYAVGTNGDASTASPLILQKLTTSDGTGNASDGNGNPGNGYNSYPVGDFDLTGFFQCPSASSQVYIVVTGGNPGIALGVDNSAISMMAVLGDCSSITESTFVSINEKTTVASIAPLANFMTSYSTLGSSASDLQQFLNDISLISEYVNTSTGKLPGPTLPAGYYASSTEITTLADAIAPCTNSDGSTAPNTPCAELFEYATPPGGTAPTDLIGALINVIKYPANNVCPIFDLPQPTAPYQPILASCPSDWTLPILQTPTAPTFSPAAGTYATGQSVTLETTPTSAVIYYTVDGSAPTTSSTVYTSAITVSSTTTIKALAVEDGRTSSSVASGTFTIDPTCGTCITPHPAAATPTFSPAGGAYTTAQLVAISDATPGSTIYYTTDGSTPGVGATKYTGTFLVSVSETINAIAVAPGLDNSPVGAATYSINAYPIQTTIAGYGNSEFTGDGPDGQQATTEPIEPQGVAVDAGGNVYIAEYEACTVRKVNSSGVISTVAGTGACAYSGDGGQATAAELGYPSSIAFDGAGNLYIADEEYSVIRKVTPAGIITTFAGTGADGFSGNGGPATSAELDQPQAVAVDKNSGNVYIAETYANHLVRVVYPSGIIETFAGIEGNSGVATSSVSATATSIGYPIGLAVDNSGNVYISDVSNAFVYEVSGGVLTYFAGNGVAGFSGDGLPATSAQISQPWGLAVDNTGIVYIGFADQGNFRVRRVLTTGNIETIAGEGNLNLPFLGAQYDDDGVLATHMQISAVSAIAVDASNNFYVADYGEDRIRKITFEATLPALPPPTINPDGGTFASGSSQTVNITDGDSTAAVYYTTDGSTPTTAATMYTGSITITGNETVKAIAVETGFSDSAIAVASFVFQAATPTFSPAAGVYTTAQTVTISDATTGSTIYYTTDGSTPTTASTQYTGTITVSASETVNAIAVATGYATSAVGSAMYQIDVNGTAPTPVISPVSGTYDTNQAITITDASPGATIYYTTDGSTPTTSSSIYPGPFMLPAGSYTVTAIAGGAGYASSATVSATYTFVTPGNVITIAGTGSQGYDGEGTATSVELNSPYAVVVDAYGNVIFADFGNQRVRKVTPSGIISTIAGNGTAGYNGDGIAATSAELNNPDAVAVDLSGNIYIADSGNNRIRMIAPNGIISTVAGTGASGYGGDGGAATSAILNQPSGVAVDSSGNLYLSDTANQIVRMVSGGVITTVAGIQGTPGTNCCNLPATATELNIPQGLAVDSSGNIYVADFGDSTIREFTVGGNMTTIAGTGTTGYNGDGIAAIAAELNQPTAVAVDMYGNVYVADEDNNRIREFSPGGPISTVAGNGTQGYNGTNMPATGTELYVPSGVFVDSNGNIFIADFGNNLVREVVQ